jgi:hypothetical protein
MLPQRLVMAEESLAVLLDRNILVEGLKREFGELTDLKRGLVTDPLGDRVRIPTRT